MKFFSYASTYPGNPNPSRLRKYLSMLPKRITSKQIHIPLTWTSHILRTYLSSWPKRVMSTQVRILATQMRHILRK